MLEAALAYAQVIAAAAADGSLFSAMVHALTTETEERGDLMLAIILIGCALGAGSWIGWEVTKFSVRLTKALLGREAPHKGFRRPASQPGGEPN